MSIRKIKRRKPRGLTSEQRRRARQIAILVRSIESTNELLKSMSFLKRPRRSIFY